MSETKYIISIDPGINGGIAIFEKETKNLVLFQKNTIKEINKKNTYDLEGFYEIFSKYSPSQLVTEAVHSMPGEGSSSSYNFGRSSGQIEGLCCGMKIPFTSITPQRWKKHFNNLINSDMETLKKEQKESDAKLKELKKIKIKKERSEKVKEETKIRNKKKYDYKKLAKTLSRECASKLYPETADILKKTTYDGIADAILIGVYYLSTL